MKTATTAVRSPMAGLKPPGFRTNQQRDRRKHRRLGVLVGAAAIGLVALGVALFARTGSDANGEGAPAARGRSTLLVLSVRPDGEGPPVAAIVGARGAPAPAAVTLFDQMTFVVPGQGDGTVADAANLPGQGLRVAVSNMLGVWAEHYAVLEPEGLAALVDRMEGIQVDLLKALETETGTLGAGTAELTGEQVVQYLDASGPNLELYWGTVLQGLLAEEPQVSPSDLAETDDPTAVRRLLGAAEGASVEAFPTVDLGGDPDSPLIQADERAAGELVESVFGYSRPRPVPVLVVNGSGTPGVGQSVAARIIPAGFRVILGQNAEEFGTRHTKVIATGSQHLEDADRARRALGSGEVAVTNVPSGLADVTIVVGTDYGSG